jgi:hypothetical protein
MMLVSLRLYVDKAPFTRAEAGLTFTQKAIAGITRAH